MEATTPAGLRTDPRDDPAKEVTAQHGDVDLNGDLVDELTMRLVPPSMRKMARTRRLAAAITAETPELARRQLAYIEGALERIPA